MKDQPCTIGEMRWKVSLASRQETQDPASSNLLENYTKIADVHAQITPTVEEGFIGGEQIGTPITHEIIFRWQPFEFVNVFDTIIRYTDLPNGQRRAEIFRIRQIKEHQGRHRYMIADCELEQFVSTVGTPSSIDMQSAFTPVGGVAGTSGVGIL